MYPDTERWRRADALFEQLLDLPPGAWPSFLDAHCGGDTDLRRQVETLLQALPEADALLQEPPNYDALLGRDGRPLDASVLAAGDDAARQAGERRIGPYRLLHPIGSGGMGTVFLAERADGLFHQRVALKQIRAGLDPSTLERFRLERQILARLEHPGITRLIDGGVTDEGVPYLVMEYVEGAPIDRYCDARRLPVEARLALFLQVCEAVQYAHRNLVVHRDLKPSNILVTEAGQVKLLDFGIAKLLDEAERSALPATLTALGGTLLTPDYAAPEQVRGEAVTTATDVYALGVILFELLTGRRPYRVTGRSAVELERVICREAVPAPSTVVLHAWAPAGEPDGSAPRITPETVAAARHTQPERLRRRLAGDLDTIVAMALRKEPERRYRSVDQLYEDVRRHLAGLPVTARKETLAYVVAKFARRHRVAVVAAGLVLLSLVGGIAATVWQAREARRQAVLAEAQAALARTEATKAERINTFLQEMLASANPEVKGRDVTVAAVLDAAAANVGEGLEQEPEVEAALRVTIGRTYQSLGLYDEAMPHLQRALALRRALFPGGHPDVAESLDRVGSLVKDQGDYPAADSLYQASLDLRRRLLGPDHVDVTESLNNLGVLRALQGDYVAAEAFMREALSIRRRHLPPEHPRLQTTMSSLGSILARQQKYAAAESLLTETLAIRRRTLGPDHALTAQTMNEVARVLEDKGDPDAAEPLFREIHAIRRRALGDDHPEFVQSLNNLAGFLADKGDYDEAEALFREAVALRRRLLGPDHPDLATSLSNLSVVLRRKGIYAEAEVLAREALAIRRKSLGPDNQLVAHTMKNLAYLHADLGRYADAERVLREALAIERKHGDRYRYEIGMTLDQLATLLLERGRHGEAEPLFRDALARYDAVVGADHPRRGSALLGLGLLRLSRGDAAGAEPLLRASFEVRAAGLPAGHWQADESKSALGAALAALGRHAEAERLLVESHAALAEKGVPARHALRVTVERLVDLYEAWDRPAEAATYRKLLAAGT